MSGSTFRMALVLGCGHHVRPADLRTRFDLNPPRPMSRWAGTAVVSGDLGGIVVHCVPDGRIVAD